MPTFYYVDTLRRIKKVNKQAKDELLNIEKEFKQLSKNKVMRKKNG